MIALKSASLYNSVVNLKRADCVRMWSDSKGSPAQYRLIMTVIYRSSNELKCSYYWLQMTRLLKRVYSREKGAEILTTSLIFVCGMHVYFSKLILLYVIY